MRTPTTPAPQPAMRATGNLAVLELLDVCKTYPAEPPVRSVRGVSLSIAPGELVAIAGPSGSGKSTLLHLMAALDCPSSGTVRIAGHDLSTLTEARLAGLRARRIGVVFQQFHLIDSLTAVENVAAGLLYRGIKASQRRRQAQLALERVGLAHRLAHRPQKLSGGERQRVAIARAVVGAPAVVLADEPTGNLDSTSGKEIIDLLTGLNHDGTTLVVITHDLTVAGAMTRQISLRDGLIESDSGRQT